MQTVRIQELQVSDTACILDLGCGEGRHVIDCYHQTNAQAIFGVDINHSDLTTANERLYQSQKYKTNGSPCQFLCADGLNLPFNNEQFDLIICSEVLEHIHPFEQMLDEIFRTLKPGGILAVSVPRAWPERICWRLSNDYHSVEGGHIRIFNAKKLKSTIQKNAYHFQKQYYAHALHTPYWWLRCANWNNGNENFFSRRYHRLLVWDLMKKPWITQALEKCLNPIFGKSIVLQFKKQG